MTYLLFSSKGRLEIQAPCIGNPQSNTAMALPIGMALLVIQHVLVEITRAYSQRNEEEALTALMLIIFLLLLLIGIPIFIALLIASFAGILYLGISRCGHTTAALRGMDVFTLLQFVIHSDRQLNEQKRSHR